jgi:glycine/D-amino acid oxidase-like deaminating enzyme
MLVLLAYRVPVAVEAAVLADNVVYRPDLELKPLEDLRHALVNLKPEALLVRALPDRDVLDDWCAALRGRSPLVVTSESVRRVIDGHAEPVDGCEADPAVLVHRVVPPEEEHELAAFLALERAYRRDAAARAVPQPVLGRESRGSRAVALVGAGVVNLVTALELVEHGYEPVVLERGPDPRTEAHWTQFGCTRGGGNARMFTLTEADNYHPKTVAAGPSGVFRLPVSETGWSVCDRCALTADEQRWIDEYEAIPPWLASVYNEDIFAFNRESGALWDRLMRKHPELFDDVELRTGILRLYTDAEHLEWSVARQRRVGAFVGRLEPEQVAEKYPALADPCAAGVFAGGVEVVGFTVNVHDFLARLLDALDRRNVTFRWATEVESIVKDRAGRVAGLRCRDAVVTAHHYVVSPGAYGNRMLRGLRCENRIHGVLGVWLTLPNVEPELTHSLKIARRGHKAEDANVTVAKTCDGERVLMVGSGYGHTGLDPRNIVAAELDETFAAVEENARTFFPRAYEAARESGLLAASQRYCVRPWTASALGVFELAPARQSGVLAVTGGHNTGGFSQAPAVAAAVLAAFRGAWHPMHELYLPDRVSGFLADGRPVPGGAATPLTVSSGAG